MKRQRRNDPTLRQGLLIEIDGPDGIGKETQTDLGAKAMVSKGYPACTVSYPRYETPSGKPIAAALGKIPSLAGVPFGMPSPQLMAMMFATNRLADKTRIKKIRASGTSIWSNRFVCANLGHQAAKIPDPVERLNFCKAVLHLEYVEHGLPRPDLTIILLAAREIRLARMIARGIPLDEQERDAAHQDAATAAYLEIPSLLPDVKLIDCAPDGRVLSPEEVHQLIWREVEPYLIKQPA